MDDAPNPAIGDCHRVGNHKKREEQQRTIGQLMKRDEPVLAKPLSAQGEQTRINSQKAETDISASRPGHDRNAKQRDPSGADELLTPLTRRDPRAGKKQQPDYHAKVGRVEQMLSASP